MSPFVFVESGRGPLFVETWTPLSENSTESLLPRPELKKVNFAFVVDVLLKRMTPWPFTRRFVDLSLTVIFRDLVGISGFYWGVKFRPVGLGVAKI